MSFRQMDRLGEGSVHPGCVGEFNQLAVLHVNQQSKVSQEIGTKDGLLYISIDENPR